jgi:hypothetical protein
MVRRYAHVSVKHLQPYADQLTFSVTPRTGGIPPVERLTQGHKNGHSSETPRVRIVAGADISH